MKFILPLSGVLLFVFCADVLAEGPEEQYVRVYNEIQQADALKERGEEQAALMHYKSAQQTLMSVKTDFSSWNTNIVNFRLKYLSEKIGPLEEKYPPAPKVSDTPAVVQPVNGLEEQLHRMNDELIRLRTDRARLESKLKEALDANPGQVDPKTLEEARDQIKELNKKIDIQDAMLASSRTSPTGGNDANKLLRAERDKNEKLEKEIKKYEALLNDPNQKLPADQMKKLESENEALKKKYQEALRQLFEKKKELIQ